MPNSKKELTPIFYGNFPVKLLPKITHKSDSGGFPLHWHESIELHRIREGSLELFCGDEQLLLKKDNVAIISPTLLHSGRASKEGVIYDVVMFDLSELGGSNNAVDFLKPLYEGKIVFDCIADNPEILAATDEIIALSNNRKNCHYMEITGKLYSLIGLFYKYCNPHSNQNRQTEEGFDGVIDYINNHFSEDISTITLSNMFGYDTAYFCRKFKSLTGMSAMKYIQILRLEKAKKLLLESTDSIKHIASLCGYSDNAYFAERFREMYGETPTKLRQSKRNSNERIL